MYYFSRLLGVMHLLVWGSTLQTIRAIPPQAPVQCNGTQCTLYNSYGAWGDRKDCHVTSVSYPTTEEELRLAVAFASKNKSDDSLLISTSKYDSHIEIDSANFAVTADAGVVLRELIDKVEEVGPSLVTAPYWEGVSVAGLISTGAHGSSWWGKGGAVHDHVKFSLERRFKRSITYNYTADSLIEKEFIEHGKKYEFGDIAWYPSNHTAVYRYDSRVSIDSPGDGINDFFVFQANEILVSESIRAEEKSIRECQKHQWKMHASSYYFGVKETDSQWIEEQWPNFHRLPSCGSPRKNANIRVTKFGDFIRDVKRLRDLKPKNFCGVNLCNGFLIRYIKASQAYLGRSEDSIVVDFSYFRADDASTPRLNQDVMEEVEQMAFFKFGAKPHWAKNRNLAFLNVESKYPNYNKFLAAKKKLDPQNRFSSEWSDQILFRKEAVKSDGCALEGLCICSEDRHCSPSKGFFCKQGLVYNEARVCRYSPSSM
ncbi:hypothetical protein CRYUN_Cryun03dG0038600 [Craigia yunnanensis]